MTNATSLQNISQYDYFAYYYGPLLTDDDFFYKPTTSCWNLVAHPKCHICNVNDVFITSFDTEEELLWETALCGINAHLIDVI